MEETVTVSGDLTEVEEFFEGCRVGGDESVGTVFSGDCKFTFFP